MENVTVKIKRESGRTVAYITVIAGKLTVMFILVKSGRRYTMTKDAHINDKEYVNHIKNFAVSQIEYEMAMAA